MRVLLPVCAEGTNVHMRYKSNKKYPRHNRYQSKQPERQALNILRTICALP